MSENILVAIGIKGNINNLGLEKFNIKTENGHIVTNHKMETNIRNIYAIGDVTSPPWLAHKASHEGVIAAEVIAGIELSHELKNDVIPGCTYSNPQIASIGLTEKQAKEKNLKLTQVNLYGKVKIYIHYIKKLILHGNGINKYLMKQKKII